MSIEERIMKIISQEVPNCKIRDAETKALPFQDIGMDSLDKMTVMLNIKDELGVDIPDDKIEQLNTFEKLVAYVETHRE